MTTKPHILNPGALTRDELLRHYQCSQPLSLDKKSYEIMQHSADIVSDIIQSDEIIYGINTGLGALSQTHIAHNEVKTLQKNLVLSHCSGIGHPLPEPVVRLAMLLKLNTIAQGYSGVRPIVADYLIQFYNASFYPVIPSQGSVGASGDLAPLAAMVAPMIGVGQVLYKGDIIDAKKALQILELPPLTLAAKEGLTLVNGTQISTALALHALFQLNTLFSTALTAGALSLEAARGSHIPLSPEIHNTRRQVGQISVAATLRALLDGSEINQSHADCNKVQDPYSLRCQPQVMGACLDQIQFIDTILCRETNAVTDNPLILSRNHIVSGGNFHAEPVALCADQMALVISEIGALSERRINLLTDSHFSGLPPFLVENSGLNSGLMIAHVTAAALASENKSYAHPASVDSIPTSANQEDHVSMATFAAARLLPMLNNTRHILAIELIAAAQGLDFLAPLKTSLPLQIAHLHIREHVSLYTEDRPLTPDIQTMSDIIMTGWFHQFIEQQTMETLTLPNN